MKLVLENEDLLRALEDVGRRALAGGPFRDAKIRVALFSDEQKNFRATITIANDSAAEAEPLRTEKEERGATPRRSTDPPWLLERSLIPSGAAFGEGAGH